MKVSLLLLTRTLSVARMLFTAPRSPFTGYLHAPPPDDDDDDAVWLLPLPLLLSPLFLIFCGQTRADVLYWMKHYYRLGQSFSSEPVCWCGHEGCMR